MIKKAATIILLLFSIFNISAQKTDINIMTFNIRLDTKADKLNSWQYRKERVANTVLENKIDIVGMQEVLHNQLIDLKKLLPEYTAVGVGRENGKEKGEYSPIFYNDEKFTLLKSGTFWLSKYPSKVGSVGWDAALPRIATWIKLKEKETGKVFFVLNSHFDHIGEIARQNSAKLILEKAKKLTKNKLPLIIMGDFNSEPASETIHIFSSSHYIKGLMNSSNVADETFGPKWSFHDFGRLPIEKRVLIDYLFVNNKVRVEQYKVIDGTVSSEYPSDHNAVMLKTTIE